MYISKFKIYKPISHTKYKSCIYKEKLNVFLKQNHTILNNFDGKFIECINSFLNRLHKNNPNIDLNLFYKNLINLSIKEKRNFNRFGFLKTGIKGIYNIKKNEIEILKNDYSFTIFHELLHCASTKKEEKFFNTGFYKKYSKFTIGRTLNEGYTSLLEERYFKNNFRYNDYSNIMLIPKAIELLIGKSKMENFYFTSDLNGLIKEFEKYGVDKKQVIFFLDELDYIKHNLGFEENKSICQEAIYNITNFLISCYKIKDSLKSEDYMNFFNIQIKVNNITYSFFNDEYSFHKPYDTPKYYIEEIKCFKKYFIK